LTESQVDTYADILAGVDEIERQARQLDRSARELSRSVETSSRGEAVYTCGRGDELVLSGETIKTDAVAVYAYGSCDVVIVNCEILAGTVAIRASGNADVEIRDSRIEGLSSAIEIEGNADVEASDTEFIGSIIESGNGEFDDSGGNTFHRR
jgi:hypothetical protein